MSTAFGQAMVKQFPPMGPIEEPEFPKVSVLHLEFEIPKRWSNKIYALAGKKVDPFPRIEKLIADSIEHVEGDEEVRLIGFTIND